jgi:adenine-specific DNA glycosylase
MMELGATVCVPNAQPRCEGCPVSACCAAYAAVQQYAQGGGDPQAAGAPRVTDYPTKVGWGG